MSEEQLRPDPDTSPAATSLTTGAAKAALRRQLIAARASRAARSGTAAGLGEGAEEQLAAVVRGCPEVAAAGTVACYVAIGDEPATRRLLDLLRYDAKQVLLPVLLPDDDLDWAPYTGAADLAAGRMRLPEPTAPRCGPEAITRADVVLVPGLAVSGDGIRLGRGGGSYDRALARLVGRRPAPFVAVLLEPEEVGVAVPVESHDRRVDAAITVAGVHRF